MKPLLRQAALITSTLLLSVTSVCNAAPPADQGIDSTSIKIGKIGDLKGVNSPKTLAAEAGVRAVFESVNSGGGINGRRLQLVLEDDQYIPDLGKKAAMKLSYETPVFAMVAANGTGPTVAMIPVITEAKIPLIGSTSGAVARTEKTSSRYYFNIRSSNYDEAKGVTTYLQAIGDKNLTIIYQDDGFGKDGLAGTQRAAKEDGVKIMAELPMNPKADSGVVNAVVKKAIATGSHTFLIFLIDKPASDIVRELANQKNSSRVICVTSCGSFDKLVDAKSLEGVIVSRFAPPLEDVSIPIVKRFHQTMVNAKRPDLAYDASAFIGFTSAEVLVEGLKNAGKTPTRESLVDALERFKIHDMGLLYFDYSTSLHDGSHYTELVMFGKNKKTVY